MIRPTPAMRPRTALPKPRDPGERDNPNDVRFASVAWPRTALHCDEAARHGIAQRGLGAAAAAARPRRDLRHRQGARAIAPHLLGDDEQHRASALRKGGHKVEGGEVPAQAEPAALLAGLGAVRWALLPAWAEAAHADAGAPLAFARHPRRAWWEARICGLQQRLPIRFAQAPIRKDTVDAGAQLCDLLFRAGMVDPLADGRDV
ncbi:hypothetical protein [Xanthobacter variabilis]|uniref:hypothetical protein n=1 Tax=Xanthobacter variabilis TaxID=3119932 RepID=UPI00372719B5